MEQDEIACSLSQADYRHALVLCALNRSARGRGFIYAVVGALLLMLLLLKDGGGDHSLAMTVSISLALAAIGTCAAAVIAWAYRRLCILIVAPRKARRFHEARAGDCGELCFFWDDCRIGFKSQSTQSCFEWSALQGKLEDGRVLLLFYTAVDCMIMPKASLSATQLATLSALAANLPVQKIRL